MLEYFLSGLAKAIIFAIIIIPIALIKKHIDKKDFVDEKKGEYAEYDKQFFEELKKKNEEYEKNK